MKKCMEEIGFFHPSGRNWKKLEIAISMKDYDQKTTVYGPT